MHCLSLFVNNFSNFSVLHVPYIRSPLLVRTTSNLVVCKISFDDNVVHDSKEISLQTIKIKKLLQI